MSKLKQFMGFMQSFDFGDTMSSVPAKKWNVICDEAARELAALEKVAEAANEYVFHGDSRKPQRANLAAALAEYEAAKKG